METKHNPNKKWRIYLLLLALICAIILFIIQIKKSPAKNKTSDVEIEVEIVSKDSTGNVIQDSIVLPENKNSLPPSLTNPNSSNSTSVDNNKEVLKPNMKENVLLPSMPTENVSEINKNMAETKKLAIKEINLKLIKSVNKPHAAFPFYNGGDEVLKGELYYLLKDNIVEQSVDKSTDIIDFNFTIDEDKTVTQFIFKTNVSREIQKKIIRELDNLKDWNTNNFKGNITYNIQLILL